MDPKRVSEERRERCCVLVAGADRRRLRDWKVASSVGSIKAGSSNDGFLDEPFGDRSCLFDDMMRGSSRDEPDEVDGFVDDGRCVRAKGGCGVSVRAELSPRQAVRSVPFLFAGFQQGSSRDFSVTQARHVMS